MKPFTARNHEAPSTLRAGGIRPLSSHGIRLLMAWGAWTALGPSLWALSITPVTPPPGGPAVAIPPELRVFVEASSSTNLTVRFYGRPTPSPIRPDFTIVALPDTQFYSGLRYGGTPAIFQAQTDWAVSNRVARNIVFVTQLGDCVERGDFVEAEWWAATNAMYRLEDPVTTLLEYGIPYGVVVGNHDGIYPWTFYNRYFGVSHFLGKPYYGGSQGTNNNNHYVLFSAGGMDFMVLELEFDAGANPATMAWANQVLQAHQSRRAIVTSHALLRPFNTNGVSVWNAQGLPIYEGLKTNRNIFLMLCGHEPQTGRRTDVFGGSTIHTLLSDYSNEPNGGDGWLRLLEFSPSNSLIRVKTYSPWLDAYKANAFHQFSISYNMSVADAGYTLISVVSNAPVGIVNAGLWPGLAALTSYDWYVTAEEDGVETRSPTWSFRTASPFFEAALSLPFEIVRLSKGSDGSYALSWRSVGGRRYRVEFSDGEPTGGFNGQFTEIPRSETDETDAGPPGTSSIQSFADDGSLTGGLPLHGARYYRVREVP